MISGLGLNWGNLFFAGSLLNVLTLTPNPGKTIRGSRKARTMASNWCSWLSTSDWSLEKGRKSFEVRDYCEVGGATGDIRPDQHCLVRAAHLLHKPTTNYQLSRTLVNNGATTSVLRLLTNNSPVKFKSIIYPWSVGICQYGTYKCPMNEVLELEKRRPEDSEGFCTKK